jgi:hypothetical protein
MILDDAEVAVILAVFPPLSAAQEHRKQQNARVPPRRKATDRASVFGFARVCSFDCVGNVVTRTFPPLSTRVVPAGNSFSNHTELGKLVILSVAIRWTALLSFR